MASGYSELDLFVADLALEAPEDDDADSNEGKITLSTVHSAKGLEWNAVLVIDLVEDRFPSRHALSRPEDFEEERRLMYVACTRARQCLDLYAPASLYNRAERGTQHVSQSPFVRELAPGMVEEWVEGFGGTLSRRSAGGVGFGRKTAMPGAGAAPTPGLGGGFSAGFSGGLLPRPQRPPVQAAYDDCQLPPDDVPASAAARAASATTGATSPGAATATAKDGELCYCRHRIFGRGKIIRHMPPDKVQVNFPGFGLKIILSEYLILES